MEMAQATFFPLRTIREEMQAVKKAAVARQMNMPAPAVPPTSITSGAPVQTSPARQDADQTMRDGTGDGHESQKEPASSDPPNSNGSQSSPRNHSSLSSTNTATGPSHLNDIGAHHARQPWENIEEIGQILKTAFPLLAMTLQVFVEQIFARFKGSSDEEIYRLMGMLLQEAQSVGFFIWSIVCT